MHFFRRFFLWLSLLFTSCPGSAHPLLSQLLSAITPSDLLKMQSPAPPSFSVQSDADVEALLALAKEHKEIHWAVGADLCRFLILNTPEQAIWQSKAWIALGGFYRKKNYCAAALACYEQASLLDPLNHIPYYKKARVYIASFPVHLYFQQDLEFQKTCFQKSIEELKTAIAIAKNPYDLFFLEMHLGNVYFSENGMDFQSLGQMQYLKAIEALKKTPWLTDQAFIMDNLPDLYHVAVHIYAEPILPDSYKLAQRILHTLLPYLNSEDLFSFSVHVKLSALYTKGGYGIHPNLDKAMKHSEMAKKIQGFLTN